MSVITFTTNPGAQLWNLVNSVDLQITANDSDSYTITYSASGLPSGTSIASATGLISGTPTALGQFSPVITATDTASNTNTLTFNCFVTSVPQYNSYFNVLNFGAA